MLATDGSDHAQLTEAFLARFPIAKSADLDVVSVCAMLPIIGVGVPAIAEPAIPEQTAALWEELHKHTKNVVNETVQRLADQGFKANPVVLDGDIAGELIDYAERSKANLVVVGSRGENALVVALLGSVARKMVGHSPCSVLVVRGQETKSVEENVADLAKKDKLTALMAVDDSPGSQAAVESFKAYGDGFGRLVCLSVRPLPVYPPAIAPMVASMEIDNPDDRTAAIAEAAAEELKGSADKVESMRAHGHPSHEIVQAAKDIGADLIILGATRHGLIERFLIGSVAYDVAAQADCSVLVIRP